MAAQVSELKFVPPKWFVSYTKRVPGKICYYHSEICENVEKDLRTLDSSEKEEGGNRSSHLEKEEREKKMREHFEIKEENEEMIQEAYKEEEMVDAKAEENEGAEGECSRRIQKKNTTWEFKQGSQYNLINLLTAGTGRTNIHYLTDKYGDEV